VVSPTAATFYFNKSYKSVLEPDLAQRQRLLDLLRNLLWNHLRNPVEPDPALHQSLPDLFSGTFLRKFIKADLALHQSLPELLRGLLRIPVATDGALQKSTPELFWAEDPISLRCWGRPHKLSLLGN
jgi:hypothetical protein